MASARESLMASPDGAFQSHPSKSARERKTVTVRIVSAQNLEGFKKRGSHLNPYCTVEIQNGSGVSAETAVKNKTRNPEWNEHLLVNDYVDQQSLVFNVWHWDPKGNPEPLGTTSVSSDNFGNGGLLCQKLEQAGNSIATLTLSISIAELKNLKVRVINARGLRRADILTGSSDPYCTIELENGSGVSARTTVKKQTVNPDWNETLSLTNYVIGQSLVFKVWDEDLQPFKGDDYLGRTTLRSDCFLPAGSGIRHLNLEEAGEGINATLCVEIQSESQQASQEPPERVCNCCFPREIGSEETLSLNLGDIEEAAQINQSEAEAALKKKWVGRDQSFAQDGTCVIIWVKLETDLKDLICHEYPRYRFVKCCPLLPFMKKKVVHQFRKKLLKEFQKKFAERKLEKFAECKLVEPLQRPGQPPEWDAAVAVTSGPTWLTLAARSATSTAPERIARKIEEQIHKGSKPLHLQTKVSVTYQKLAGVAQAPRIDIRLRTHCKCCQQPFSQNPISGRWRHHCKICGEVFCKDCLNEKPNRTCWECGGRPAPAQARNLQMHASLNPQ